MRVAELRQIAEVTAADCRDVAQDCLYCPGNKSLGLSPKDCPMHPTPCRDVTADMWFRDLHNSLTLYGVIEEDE